MSLGVTRGSEFEYSGGGDGDADAVRDERCVAHIPAVHILPRILRGDGVAHPMAQMHACVAEAYTRKRGGEEHLALGFEVVRVLGGAGKVLDCGLEGLKGEDVGDGVGALVGGSVERVRRARRAFRVGDRGPGFECVAEDVEARGGVHGGGHGAGVEGVADAEGGFEGAVGDAGFGALGDEVEDGGAGGFAAGAGGGGDGD